MRLEVVPPQARALLEAVPLGVSEECAPRTARSTSVGALWLTAVCTEFIFLVFLLGSHVRRNISRESSCGSRGYLFAPEHLGELVNVGGAVLSLPSIGIACLHAW